MRTPRGLGAGSSLATAGRRANDALYALTKNTLFSAVPLDRLYDVVETAGFSFDPEEQACILCGREGKATWDLYFQGRPVNRVLAITWYKMETGRYEVVAYVN